MTMKSTSVRLSEEALAELNRFAGNMDRSRSWVIAEAVQRYIEDAQEMERFVQEGIESGEREGWIPHEDVMERAKQRFLHSPADAAE